MEPGCNYIAVKQEIAALLEELESGNSLFIELAELEVNLETAIQAYENNKK